jgi:hypothetical protein
MLLKSGHSVVYLVRSVLQLQWLRVLNLSVEALNFYVVVPLALELVLLLRVVLSLHKSHSSSA